MAIALEKLDFINSKKTGLAPNSTINRLEYCPETIINQKESRYHRIEHDPKAIEKAFVEIFLADYKKPPREIVLDMDVTDDQVHGNRKHFSILIIMGYVMPLYTYFVVIIY